MTRWTIAVHEDDGARDGGHRLVSAGVRAWAVLGIVGVLIVAYLVLSQVAVVVVPLLLALFVAGALEPLARLLRRLRLPPWFAALATLLLGVGLVSGVVALVVPLFRSQVPALVDSLGRSVGQLERALAGIPGAPLNLQQTVARLAERVLGDGTGGVLGGALGTTVGFLTGLILTFVAAFFYLAQGRSLVEPLVNWLPADRRAPVRELAGRLWEMVGHYVRGVLLVALLDATGIGLGLLLLGVPLALPLAVVVYLGAFVPVVGAFVSGLLAVLVAFADGGVGIALAALAVVLAVQQLEGHVLQPLVMGRAIRLPAFVVLIAVAIGITWLGIVGGLLAVPVAAALARTLEYLAERRAAESSMNRAAPG